MGSSEPDSLSGGGGDGNGGGGGEGGGGASSGPVEYRAMSRRERLVCSTLCACLAAAVLSAVAMVYLTVIVYLPARRELALGLGASAAMCTTVEKRHVRGDIGACRWSSCVEWCLSRGGGDCTHLYVRSGGETSRGALRMVILRCYNLLLMHCFASAAAILVFTIFAAAVNKFPAVVTFFAAVAIIGVAVAICATAFAATVINFLLLL